MSDVEARLAEVLVEHAWNAAFGGCPDPCGWQSNEREDEQDEHAAHVAAVLAPIVADEVARAVEALRLAEHADLRAAFERDKWAGEWNSMPTAIDRLLARRREAKP